MFLVSAEFNRLLSYVITLCARLGTLPASRDGRSVAGLSGVECGAATPDAQMKLALSTFPVDRYLVESSDKKEIDEIPFEDLWQIEPMMRPEDEAMQRKLQELLQATTEELKILSSDLHNIHQHSTAIKTEKTPFDEVFNEKIHIEELVTSKFNNIDFFNRSKRTSNNSVQQNLKSTELKKAPTTLLRHRNSITSLRNPSTITNKLSKSEIKLIHITPNESKSKLNIEQMKKNENSSDYYFKYEPDLASTHSNPLSMHKMPQVDIRGECKKQNIFQIDIIPYENVVPQHCANNATIEIQHEKQAPVFCGTNNKAIHTEYDVQPKTLRKYSTNRKVTKISAHNSSESTNSSTSEVQNMHQLKSVFSLKPSNSKHSPQSAIIENKTHSIKASSFKIKEKRKNKMNVNTTGNEKNYPHKAAYLPYSHLTLGGITLSDLERAMSEIPPHNMPLSPILDQIINIREHNITNETKSITASEENLIRHVQDLKHNLTKTLIETKSYEKTKKKQESEDAKAIHISSDDEAEYDDDFEDDDVDKSKTESGHTISQPLKKSRILTLRDTIETHEFVPQVTFKDTETQCNSKNIQSLRLTQPSPKNISIQPINNVLWPLSTDTNSEVNQAFKLEKEIIKKLILEEYGDVINKGTTAASTSNYVNKDINKNTVVLQKNTQTSPARVKSVMTSPTRHKTRTTSPVTLDIAIDKQTSPQTFVVNQKQSKPDIVRNESAELALSVDLSSATFNVHLPRTSHDGVNNLTMNQSYIKTGNFPRVFQYSVKRDNRMHDTSSTTAEVSSSEVSSLGEVKHKVGNCFSRKLLSPRETDSSDSSVTSRSSMELFVRVKSFKSDGEVTQLSSGAN